MAKVLTPADLANPSRQSGYNGVGVSHGGSVRKKPFFANWRDGDTIVKLTRRATALEAAQDYCNHFNNGVVPATPTLKSAGHNGKRDSLPMNDEVQEALGILRDARAARKGKQGYVYLITEVFPGGGLRYGKIGFSTNPAARVAELQTGNPRPLKLLYMKPGTEADESALHAKYSRFNCLQEWFWVTKELLLEWDASHAVK